MVDKSNTPDEIVDVVNGREYLLSDFRKFFMGEFDKLLFK